MHHFYAKTGPVLERFQAPTLDAGWAPARCARKRLRSDSIGTKAPGRNAFTAFGVMMGRNKATASETMSGGRAMRLVIEILAALLLVLCVGGSSAGFAAGGRSADGLSCAFSVPQNASPAARCAAIRRQCGGKFWANYCGDKMLSAN
jgi:hypothetical protein